VSADDLTEIRQGMRLAQKSLPPKFFYDDQGSRLFDQICMLPEYYPTRTELGIMRRNIGEIASLAGPRASLIEYGSGSSLKTRILLEHLEELAVYVPVDISHQHLADTAMQIRSEFPEVEVLPVTANFMLPFDLPEPTVMPLRNIIYFPGSTIGNFDAHSARELMKGMHIEAGEGGALLIGVDLRKDNAILERAYNDAQGVTALFNLNMLHRLNREFGSDFDVSRFEHRAIYNSEEGRIEMHLDSLADQSVSISGESFSIHEGESILTEHSYKYTIDGFAALAESAGFRVHQVWTDPERMFSVQYCLRV
jgi:dimethylhistidine N-methyltransferase